VLLLTASCRRSVRPFPPSLSNCISLSPVVFVRCVNVSYQTVKIEFADRHSTQLISVVHLLDLSRSCAVLFMSRLSYLPPQLFATAFCVSASA